jgi:hypothetical protein
MRYSNAKMTGAFPQAASGMATAGSKAALAGAVSDIILGVNERQIAPGETARFPFVACTAYGIPSIHEFNVISDNPNFNPAWVRLGPSAGNSYSPRYILEISPGYIGRSQYGAYPLRLSWRAAGTYRHAGGRCTLIIRPCVRAVTEPVVAIWPTGHVCVLLENRGSTGNRCGDLDKAPRLGLVEGVGVRPAGEGRRPVQFFRAVRSADRNAQRRL